MKKHLLKYFLIVLALFASAGLLWAEKNGVNTGTKNETTTIDQHISLQSSDSNLNALDSMNGSALNEPKSDSEVIHKNIFKNEDIWLLFIPTIIIVLFILCYLCSKMKDKKIKKLRKNEGMVRVLSKITNNVISRDVLSIIGAFIIVVFLIVLITFILFLLIRGFDTSRLSEFSFSRLGQIGDFSSGVLGTLVASVVAVYAIRTFRMERNSQKETSLQTVLSSMLELHRKNVDEIKIEKTDESNKYVLGREAFKQMYEELKAIYENVENTIHGEVEKDSIKYAEYQDEKKQKKLAHILSYGYFFYDADKYMITKSEGGLTDLCDVASRSVPYEYRNLNRHLVLGHYFRHLYNMVNYVDKSDFNLKHKNKEKYVKLIRSQLSDYEEVLLYYDSLSLLGWDWNEPLGKEIKDDMNLICKYRMLKNCPYYIEYFGIKPSKTYEKEIAVWNGEGEMFFETDVEQLMPKLNKILNGL